MIETGTNPGGSFSEVVVTGTNIPTQAEAGNTFTDIFERTNVGTGWHD